MNGNFQNQTPPDNGHRPDYSYNWNGSEHNRGNKKLRIIAIVSVSVIIFILICTAVGFALKTRLDNGGSDLFGDGNVDHSIEVGEDKPKEDKPKEDKPKEDKPPKPSDESEHTPPEEVPSFTPSDDSDKDLSTTYTEIFNNVSPSCCTVKTTVSGRGYSTGSGFVIDSENGYIATNHHVIEGGDKVTVIFYDGREFDAVVVGSDSVTDIAVLQVSEKGLPQVEFGDSNNIAVGENVVAIGTPYSMTLAGSMTRGIVSGVSRKIDITNDSGKVVKTMTLIQTDCSINPGNSGGPLIDMAGNVIGITSMKLVDEQFEGIGFAIPITDAAEIFKKLIAGEEIGESNIATASPKIGISTIDAEYGLQLLGIRPNCEYPTEGLLIAEISASSSAYKAGMGAYNIIVDFNGDKITTNDELTTALAKYKAGDTVTVKLFQFNRTFTSGEYVDITFKLDAAG